MVEDKQKSELELNKKKIELEERHLRIKENKLAGQSADREHREILKLARIEEQRQQR